MKLLLNCLPALLCFGQVADGPSQNAQHGGCQRAALLLRRIKEQSTLEMAVALEEIAEGKRISMDLRQAILDIVRRGRMPAFSVQISTALDSLGESALQELVQEIANGPVDAPHLEGAIGVLLNSKAPSETVLPLFASLRRRTEDRFYRNVLSLAILNHSDKKQKAVAEAGIAIEQVDALDALSLAVRFVSPKGWLESVVTERLSRRLTKITENHANVGPDEVSELALAFASLPRKKREGVVKDLNVWFKKCTEQPNVIALSLFLAIANNTPDSSDQYLKSLWITLPKCRYDESKLSIAYMIDCLQSFPNKDLLKTACSRLQSEDLEEVITAASVLFWSGAKARECVPMLVMTLERVPERATAELLFAVLARLSRPADIERLGTMKNAIINKEAWKGEVSKAIETITNIGEYDRRFLSPNGPWQAWRQNR